jgi:hypothetical protein
MIDVKTLKEGDRIEMEIDAPNNTTITRTATYLKRDTACLDEPIFHTETKSGVESGLFLSSEKSILDKLGLSSKKEEKYAWLVRGYPDNFACRVTRIIPAESIPAWKKALPEGAVKTPILETKLDDRVRVFFNEGTTEQSEETERWVDATVVGNGGLIGWLPGETLPPDSWGMPSAPSYADGKVTNITDYARVGWLRDNAACYVLPPEPVWKKTLPEGSTRSTLKAVKVGDRVRVFTGSHGIFWQNESATDNYYDLTVVGIESGIERVCLAARYDEKSPEWFHPRSLFANSIGLTVPNSADFTNGWWERSDALCYILPEVKEQVADLKSALKQVETAVNEIAASLPEQEKNRLKTELNKLLKIDLAEVVSAKPEVKEVSVPKPITQSKLSDAKIGDTVEIFLDRNSGGYGSWNKTDLTLKTILVGRTSGGQAILGWKEKPEAARNFSWYSSKPIIDDKVPNFDDFKHFCQYGNTECNILPPEPVVRITLSQAKLGDRVRLSCLGGWLSMGPQATTIDATVVGNNGGSSVVLGLNDKKDLQSVVSMDNSSFAGHIKLDGAVSAFTFGRWASGRFMCEVLPAESLVPKDGVVPVSDVKIGSRVKVFYNRSTGLLSSKETEHSFEATVIGSSVNVLLGIKASDFPGSVSAIKGMSGVSDKHIKVDNKLDFSYARWATRNAKCVVLSDVVADVKVEEAPPQEVKLETKPIGDVDLGARVRIFLTDTNMVSWEPTSRSVEATIVGRFKNGNLLLGEDDFGDLAAVREIQEEIRSYGTSPQDDTLITIPTKFKLGRMVAPKHQCVVMPAKPKVIFASEAGVGARINLFIRPDNSISWSEETDRTIEATIISQRHEASNKSFVIGWKTGEKLPIEIKGGNYYTPTAYKSEMRGAQLENLSDYIHAYGCSGITKCILVSSPASIKKEQIKEPIEEIKPAEDVKQDEQVEEPKKADIGSALMLLGAVVGAGISAMMAPKTQVRVEAPEEELPLEDIEVEADKEQVV